MIERDDEADRTWCMSEVDIFRDLSEPEMEAIAEAAPMKTYSAGETLHSPQQPGEVLFILKRGRVPRTTPPEEPLRRIRPLPPLHGWVMPWCSVPAEPHEQLAADRHFGMKVSSLREGPRLREAQAAAREPKPDGRRGGAMAASATLAGGKVSKGWPERWWTTALLAVLLTGIVTYDVWRAVGILRSRS